MGARGYGYSHILKSWQDFVRYFFIKKYKIMTGIQRKKRIKWWIYFFSPFIIFLVWGLSTTIFWYIKWSWISENIERLQLVQAIINLVLAVWSLVTTVLMVIWSVWIIRYSDDPEYHPYIWNHKKISELSDTEIELAKRHNIKKRFSPIWAVILNLLTLWMFGLFYYGRQHGNFPRIRKRDLTWASATWFMFIPIFSVYRQFRFWINLTQKLNTQYILRNEKLKLSMFFVVFTMIITLLSQILPMMLKTDLAELVNYIYLWVDITFPLIYVFIPIIISIIFKQIVIFKIQKWLNWLIWR